jgi:hypothetical protein
VNTHDGSHPTIGIPASQRETGEQRFVPLACLVQQALRNQRSPATHIVDEMNVPSGAFEQFDGRDPNLRLGEAAERVAKEHDVTALARALGRTTAEPGAE